MFLEETLFVLEAADVGTSDTDLFVSSGSTVPAGNGPITTVTEVMGGRSTRTHDRALDAYESPEAQIKVRAKTYATAREYAWRAYRAISAVANITILGTEYVAMHPRQTPFDMGIDATGRVMVGFNFRATKRPSI